jgi:hypothetical protein
MNVLFGTLQVVADQDYETAKANSSMLSMKLVANQNFLVTIGDQVVSFFKFCPRRIRKGYIYKVNNY